MICSKCNQDKQYEEFVKDKNKKNGIRSYCKECENLRRRKTPLIEKKEGKKYCKKCNSYKTLDNFASRIIKGELRYYSHCKECEREYNRKLYPHKCSMCGKEYRTGRKNSVNCKDCYRTLVGEKGAKVLNSIDWKGSNNPMYGVHRYGKENPNYKEDKTDEERILQRGILGYSDWRKAVYERDSYTCVVCGDNEGGNLQAHHLNGYADFPQQRLDVDNGVTLCNKCHKKYHTQFSYFHSRKEDFYKFLKQYDRAEVSN